MNCTVPPTRCLKLNTLCIKLVSTFNLITTQCLKLNTLCIKLVSTFNLITTQCWNWIHYASNWRQLSTWSQPGVEIEMHYKANLFQYDQQSKTNFISQAPTSTVSRWLKVAKVSIWKAGTWTSPSPSLCWKACSSSPCNGSSPHGKFKPATDKNRKNILWSSTPNNQTYIVHTTPLVNILQNVGPNELSIVPGPRQSQEITTL
jgi:hypothetical protein